MKRPILLAAMLLAFGTANAIDLPSGSTNDAGIQFVTYQSDDIVRMRVSPKEVTRVILNEGETITNVFVGLPTGYEISNTANTVAIKAISMQMGEVWVKPDEQWTTSLDIETKTPSGLRQYALKMEVSDNPARRIHYRYPLEVESKRKAAERVEAAAKAAEEAKRYAQANPKPIDIKNLNYVAKYDKRSASIVPLMAYDDGNNTYLEFGKNQKIPATFLDDNEGVSNGKMMKSRPRTMMIKSIAKTIRLRLDLGMGVVKVAKITNRSFTEAGAE